MGVYHCLFTQEKCYVLYVMHERRKKVMKCGMAFIIHDKDSYYANKEQIKELLVHQNDYENKIFKASTVEYKGKLYLIIDGHSSLLDWKEPSKELEELKELYEDLKEECEEFGDEVGEFVDRRFLHNFHMLTYPAYAKNPIFFCEAYKYIRIKELCTLFINNQDGYLGSEDEREVVKILIDDQELMMELDERFKKAYSRENICYGFVYGRDFDLGSLVFEEKENKIDALSKDIFNATIEEKNVKEVKFIETLYEIG